ncbi:hypothetical protein [Microbacterium sp. CIAB417]|uniref:hypothetical protein n=1 Tax=Microbacterium sp. CIAB417 TaxID=2860287 RepID=UPI001FAC6FA0|nr:hypothetical protein [Microbacterium sp. CIAB417]
MTSFGALNTAQIVTRSLALNPHQAVQPEGLFVGPIAIGVFIGIVAPQGWPHRSPAATADATWEVHAARNERELVIS